MPGRYTITLKEPLGKHWHGEIATCTLPSEIRHCPVRVSQNGAATACQKSGGLLAILVENLQPGEERTCEIHASDKRKETAENGVRFVSSGADAVFTNSLIALKLPATQQRRLQVVPGPILAVRRGNSPWLGRGRLESPFAVRSIKTQIVEKGELWTTVEVVYTFDGGHTYRVRIQMRPTDEVCEVQEESTLPVRLWPAPRPYREIGTLGKSFWDQPPAAVANPCSRPCPTSNFIFDVRAGLCADRMVTHSTGSWEIMDLPLEGKTAPQSSWGQALGRVVGAPTLKTYTAMRPALPFIDGGWMGVYRNGRDELLGVASLDITHWRGSDDVVHPAHRTPGASMEVLLLDSKDDGSCFRFPIENMTRRWLLAVMSRKASEGLGNWRKPKGKPVRIEPNCDSPLWAIRTRRGDLRLDKVKDWIVDWPDAGDKHPRILCGAPDFPAIRRKIRSIPELRRNYEKTHRLHAADHYLMTGESGGLKAIEMVTQARVLIENILARGYAGPIYAIGLSRALRRYVLACDIMWDTFTPGERREARRVCALGGYIMTDGDWWQYAWRKGETTYLPNFNTDVFTSAGLIGLFLSNHPCSKVWVRSLVQRLDFELKHHLREDGGGEENGHYLWATWSMLYFSVLWALRHGGIKDYSSDPNVLAGARFLIKTLGPPDPRDAGRRMMPPIGHHPHVRKALSFGPWLASFLKDSDPVLAGNLMWAWRQTGALVYRNPDHQGPEADPLTQHYIFHDSTIRETPPKLGSYNFPRVGVALRSHDDSGKGSFLFLKAGRVHSHHDEDEGSFHYFGRGAPLALDGLPIQNGAKANEHNAVTFGKYGQPSGVVECFKTTDVADYVRARIAPRGFACDAMYIDDTHRSGWTREIVFIKSSKPGGVEYVIVKDSVVGPDPCQWNLDVLSQKPRLVTPRQAQNRVWFPGHEEFGMGLDVIITAPARPKIVLEKGVVNPQILNARGRRKLPENHLLWPVVEHWLMHTLAPPGTTFAVVLFPRRPAEKAPVVEYLEREETISIRHAEGRDLVFLRPNPMVGVNINGVVFRGKAGVLRERHSHRVAQPLDEIEMRLVDYPDRSCSR
ncbi:MAG: hypothetical protein HY360_18310 [Verrucomicrobia bacterium]|nr:hypothetical protein [Verrucomicrobiota bacterium]